MMLAQIISTFLLLVCRVAAQASWQDCFDCRFCFDCGSHGTCALPVEQRCWGQGVYTACSPQEYECNWFDYANPPSMPESLRAGLAGMAAQTKPLRCDRGRNPADLFSQNLRVSL